MKRLLFLALSLLALNLSAQIKTTDVAKADLPQSIKYKADFQSGQTWTDTQGKHFLVLSQTKLIVPKIALDAASKFELLNVSGKLDTIRPVEAYYREQAMYAYHFILKGDSASLVWKNLAVVINCPNQLTLENLCAPIVTDLDADGIAEVWRIYWFGCRVGKAVALNMELVMDEGNSRAMIKGSRSLKYGEKMEKTDGGVMEPDTNYNSLDPKIKAFGLELWQRYGSEN